MRITIVGNSVGLRCRPANKLLNYGQLLSNYTTETGANFEVVNLCLGRLTTIEAVFNKDVYIRTYPNYFILNLGSVDAPSREIPLWYSNVIYGRRGSFLSSLLIPLYGRFISRYRSLFTRVRFKRSWVSEHRFCANMESLIMVLKKETNAKIVVLGINSGSDRIEKQLPGTLIKYAKYDSALEKICADNSVHFISTRNLGSDMYFPDGVHFNAAGHEYIAKRIMCVI